MSIETGIVALLRADEDVAALVVARIYPLTAPPGASAPYIVYQRVATPKIRSLEGESGWAGPRFQLTIWASSYAGARTLADHVHDCLADYSGEADDVTVIHGAFVDEDDVQQAPTDLDQRRFYGIRQDWDFWHEE